MGVKGDKFPLQVQGSALLGYGVLRHRRFSVVNASYAKTSQEHEPKAKRDWLMLTAAPCYKKQRRKKYVRTFKMGEYKA